MKEIDWKFIWINTGLKIAMDEKKDYMFLNYLLLKQHHYYEKD